MLKEFRDFAFKGDVINLAIGIVIGAAFGAIVKAFIDYIVNPLIGLLGGGTESLEAMRLQITPTVAIGYGAFLSAILSFLIVAFALFLVIQAVNRFRAAEESTERDCPYCLSSIPKAATRCANCTSEVAPE
jgi:large conductance mechanosensitive channel